MESSKRLHLPDPHTMPPPRFAPNWFVGIPIPSEGWFDKLVPLPPGGLRRFHPDDLHLTVAFLGSVEEVQARAGWDALGWDLPPTTATLGQVVPMGAPHRYSALSIELVQARTAIEQALGRCRDAICDAAGVRREHRPPKAHVTIARPSRRAGEQERSAGLRWAQRLDFHQQPVLLDSIALYTWSDDRRDRQFKVVLRSAWT
jgi:2'-5' RNA ligase